MIGENGKLYPWAGKDYTLYITGGDGNWKDSNYYWENSGTCTIRGDGSGCAARIIENGWKMDY